MKISIIVPIYNVSKYIVRCLNSVVEQTYQDIECILIDDCGTDDSMQIVEDFIYGYHGPIEFKVLHHERNRGQSAARNTGLMAASGEYLFFLDGDDALLPDSIEKLARLAVTYSSADFVQGNFLDDNGNISRYGFCGNIPQFCDDKEQLYTLMLTKIVTSACNRLISQSFVMRHQLLFPEGILHEDMYWVYFLAKYATAAAFTQAGTYIYYTNDGSTMTATTKQMRYRRYVSRMKGTETYMNDICQNGSNYCQRQYVAVNLLSCLVELNALHSLHDWFHFWMRVNHYAFLVWHKASFFRFLFYLVLMPPLCFLSHRDNLRWRIQQVLVAHI